MCGISGIISFNKEVEPPEVIIEINNLIRHRGPDGEGYLTLNFADKLPKIWYGKETPNEIKNRSFKYSPQKSVESDLFSKQKYNLAFGHRRLSIIDLSPLGHQPMSNENGSIWIVYNGEIYNYIELKELLIKKGYRFTSKTDTEVIIHSYEEWGEACVEKFNGMWAFALLDLKNNFVFFSRDRTGVKPLYYYSSKEHLVFASVLKSVLKVAPVRVNYGVVWDYLVLKESNYFRETFYDGILELEPASNMIVDFKGNITVKKYWKPELNLSRGAYHPENANNLIAKTRELIEAAVRIRLRSDVAVGSCLSGGIDSSTIVVIAEKLLEKNKSTEISNFGFKTFTSSFEDEKFDERRYVRTLADCLKISPFYVFPTENGFIADIHRLIKIQEMPFSSTSIYAQYKVMEKAKEENVKVLLDGQGGDELFGGYNNYSYVALLEMIKSFRLYTLIKEIILNSHNSELSFYNQIKGMIAELSKSLPLRLRLKILQNFRNDLKILNRDFLLSNLERSKIWGERFNGFSLGRRLYEDFMGRNLQGLLRYEDKNSMAFSIESRTPFADDKNLIEFIFSVPSCYKVKNGWGKYLLREAVKDILPSEICWRRNKMGFVTPEKVWMKNLVPLWKEAFANLDSYVFNRVAVESQIRKIEEEGSTDLGNMWRPLNYLLWKNT